MSTFILSLDPIDEIRDGESPISFSTLIDDDEDMEIRSLIPAPLWKAYDCPVTILVQVIM
jgi:hypothetical protein